jgi:protein-S-isoprenylcysteine O-methyltransferase Ste14
MNEHSTPITEVRLSPWMRIPPPLLFLATFAMGIWLDAELPCGTPPVVLRAPGLVMIAAAILLITSAGGLFLRRKTTIIPHGRAATLVTSGPYRITRNPMYVGLALCHFGAALALGALWPLGMVVVGLWVLQTKTIPYEEDALRVVFGEAYVGYTRRVRRWL